MRNNSRGATLERVATVTLAAHLLTEAAAAVARAVVLVDLAHPHGAAEVEAALKRALAELVPARTVLDARIDSARAFIRGEQSEGDAARLTAADALADLARRREVSK